MSFGWLILTAQRLKSLTGMIGSEFYLGYVVTIPLVSPVNCTASRHWKSRSLWNLGKHLKSTTYIQLSSLEVVTADGKSWSHNLYYRSRLEFTVPTTKYMRLHMVCSQNIMVFLLENYWHLRWFVHVILPECEQPSCRATLKHVIPGTVRPASLFLGLVNSYNLLSWIELAYSAACFPHIQSFQSPFMSFPFFQVPSQLTKQEPCHVQDVAWSLIENETKRQRYKLKHLPDIETRKSLEG